MKALTREFEAPGSQYRGKPFWAWNGKLEPEELRRQVRILHRMGLGGGFMHSRVGLDTPYLAKEWFECVDAVRDECKKLDMEAWLYDEDRWPSGAAGGLVTKNPKHRMRCLAMHPLDSPRKLKWNKDTIAAFTAKIKGRVARQVQPIARGKRPKALTRGETILVFQVESQPLNSWYNGYTYLDTMSHEAVKEFIRVTHEAYRKHCGTDFGKTIPGIFTDEPNHGSFFGRTWTGVGCSVPWTPRLPQVFRQRYGYDVASHLMEVFFDVDGEAVSQARYHYHDCVTHLFVDAFARQIGEWCDKHKLSHTGHVLAENTPTSQTGVVGSAMRFYEYMQAPGMDLLTEHNREFGTAKMVSSVARQFGRKWRLTETYGCTGWDFPFAGHKALGDWQVALGINLRCQHLSWYTMEGQAKRDYPAGIFYQSPWWELYPKVEDYYARVHAVMTRGQEVRDLLVIHPVESAWLLSRMAAHEDPTGGKLNRMLVSLRDTFLHGNIDFDYGEEEILARHAKVTTKDGSPLLKVGKATYKAVVVPPLITMRASTLKVLKRFRAAGGTVVFAGRAARYVDAVPSREVAALARTCTRAPAKGKVLLKAVDPLCRRLSITDKRGLEIMPTLHLLRADKDAYYLFVCNTGHAPHQIKADASEPLARDRKTGFPFVRIRGLAECKGQPVELDAETGAMTQADAKQTRQGWEIHTSLPALGSRLYVIPKKRGGLKAPKRKACRDVRSSTLAGQQWDIVLSEANNLVLDRPAYKIGEARWQKPEEVLRVDFEVRDALGIRHRGGQMVQPWARERKANPKCVPVKLRYRFEVKAIPSGELYVALEQPKTFRICVNGTRLDMDAECGWWCDRSLRKIPLDPALLHVGKNQITLLCDYSEDHPGLEIVYLLGNFGTRVRGTDLAITQPRTRLKLGDWVKQGLAFYSGSVAYCRKLRPKLRKGERLIVQVPEYRGVAVRVLVDGTPAGVIGWEPNEVDVTELLPEKNHPVDLRIEVIGHRRNSHGPLHLSEKWPRWTGPGQYVSSGDGWVDAYQLVPCGLMKPPRLVVRK